MTSLEIVRKYFPNSYCVDLETAYGIHLENNPPVGHEPSPKEAWDYVACLMIESGFKFDNKTVDTWRTNNL